MDFQLNYPDSKAVFGIAISIIAYYTYYYLITSEKIEKYFIKKYTGNSFQKKRILFNKLAGLTFLALIPGTLFIIMWEFELNSLGFSFDKIISNWYWLIGLPAIIFIINYFSAKKPDIYLQYPQMRIKSWSIGTFLLSTLGWSLYLISYEFLFRGVLLLSCIEAFGIWPAIAINIAIYSAIHMTNGVKETIGAIPFGLIACLLMVHTGSLLIPIIMHISLSVSTEFFTIRNNPDMEFKKSSKP
ncbi:MAG: CPBP family intramembrane metalloprotease [Mariniphaga sp.]|nr:CPBP family intramembrane metalloprotease [Mariniphaga sp.]